MKPRPRLTPDNNPLQRRPTAAEPALPAESVRYAIPEDLRPQLQALQQQWRVSETEVVAIALRFFLTQVQRRPVAPHPPADNDQLMGFLD
ncbi:MAG: hypothetical protein RMI89_00150 [Gloeomargarita sp. SKYBB_i_bin120]|nr:hypothetical protein [Gloeomargarita sp. SKYG98]MCS7291373.1 hypothetical protein [Gloeomargarita sp. SKYB120]MDW8176933.1 hypothetical protein [Gloeomargarita sp. SKYBB_i_bin120]